LNPIFNFFPKWINCGILLLGFFTQFLLHGHWSTIKRNFEKGFSPLLSRALTEELGRIYIQIHIKPQEKEKYTLYSPTYMYVLCRRRRSTRGYYDPHLTS
jgi:hypothetical protein